MTISRRIRPWAGWAVLLASSGCSIGASAQDTSAPGRYGIADLTGGFRPDPHRVEVEAGGPDAPALDGCSGFISAERPDYEVDYSAPSGYELGFYVVADADTTLVVNDPSGTWWCNDDFGGHAGHNPGVVFASPAAGNYDIWVGAYDETANGASAELIVTEIGAPWEPSYGAIDLSAAFDPDPRVAEVVAGGQDAAATVAEGCTGYVTAGRADFGITYSDAGRRYRLGVFADSAADTTLMIRDPAGRWFCNDDYSEAGGHNPGVVFDTPADGFYQVWVGTYSADDTGRNAELIVTERGSPWDGAAGREGTAPRGGDGTELVSSGTGFGVSRNGHVVTNNHVVAGCTRMTFQVLGQLAVAAELLASNATTDLALLKTDLVFDEPALFRGESSLRLGDEVVVYGFPLLGELSSQGNITNGIVSALSGLGDDLTRMQITAQIQPGNSGGPVMDRSGNVVGVVVERANDEYFLERSGTVPQNVNFAIRDSLTRSFLDTNNVGYDVARPGTSLSVADIAERAQRFTGTILCYQ